MVKEVKDIFEEGISFDDIELENEALDTLMDAGWDIMSDPILTMSVKELANMAKQKELEIRQQKDLKQKEREDAKRKAELKKRHALLNKNDGYNQFSKLMRDFPAFDSNKLETHWTSSLVRILTIIGYQLETSVLANLNYNTEYSNIEIVKSHLCLATFDHIYTQMSDFIIANPEFMIDNSVTKQNKIKAGEEPAPRVYQDDANTDGLSDPNWGAW